MSAAVSLYSDSDRSVPVEFLLLGDLLVEETPPGLGTGNAIRVYGRNTGDTELKNVSIALDGEGSQNVQLARDENGEAGVWAAPGEPVIIEEDFLGPDGDFSFWARAVYTFDDREGRYPFQFVVRALSVG